MRLIRLSRYGNRAFLFWDFWLNIIIKRSWFLRLAKALDMVLISLHLDILTYLFLQELFQRHCNLFLFRLLLVWTDFGFRLFFFLLRFVARIFVTLGDGRGFATGTAEPFWSYWHVKLGEPASLLEIPRLFQGVNIWIHVKVALIDLPLGCKSRILHIFDKSACFLKFFRILCFALGLLFLHLLIYLLHFEFVNLSSEILLLALISLTIGTNVIVKHIPVFSLFILVFVYDLVLDLDSAEQNLLLLGVQSGMGTRRDGPILQRDMGHRWLLLLGGKLVVTRRNSLFWVYRVLLLERVTLAGSLVNFFWRILLL